jgi:hypothetical protein
MYFELGFSNATSVTQKVYKAITTTKANDTAAVLAEVSSAYCVCASYSSSSRRPHTSAPPNFVLPYPILPPRDAVSSSCVCRAWGGLRTRWPPPHLPLHCDPPTCCEGAWGCALRGAHPLHRQLPTVDSEAPPQWAPVAAQGPGRGLEGQVLARLLRLQLIPWPPPPAAPSRTFLWTLWRVMGRWGPPLCPRPGKQLKLGGVGRETGGGLYGCQGLGLPPPIPCPPPPMHHPSFTPPSPLRHPRCLRPSPRRSTWRQATPHTLVPTASGVGQAALPLGQGSGPGAPSTTALDRVDRLFDRERKPLRVLRAPHTIHSPTLSPWPVVATHSSHTARAPGWPAVGRSSSSTTRTRADPAPVTLSPL